MEYRGGEDKACANQAFVERAWSTQYPTAIPPLKRAHDSCIWITEHALGYLSRGSPRCGTLVDLLGLVFVQCGGAVSTCHRAGRLVSAPSPTREKVGNDNHIV